MNTKITKNIICAEFIFILSRYIQHIGRVEIFGGSSPEILTVNGDPSANEEKNLYLSLDQYSTEFIRPLVSEMSAKIEAYHDYQFLLAFSDPFQSLPKEDSSSSFCNGIRVVAYEEYSLISKAKVLTFSVGLTKLKFV